ncbi:hypothetical protein OV203_08420 [Nannocystis sp. ILAH1]|uniref:hypothetical protein n=1 Tax=unclassified Nannocystis TaxID=2627009 RepID=UPI00227001E9|nr:MULTISPECIES: hypothetical protein [unclassified Nannocystis]MCY0987145.1 hypothetical protein [Nannocystis sp. ILAH1]MCY1072028.1 hypothetical protein [Nannocystis sp. RBIL2]
MRDRKTGRVRWTDVGGEHDSYQTFEMFGDGTARRTTGGSIDLCNGERVVLDSAEGWPSAATFPASRRSDEHEP